MKIKLFWQLVLALAFLSGGALFGVYTYQITSMGLSGDRWLSASTTITYSYATRPWGDSITKRSGVEYALFPSYSFVAVDGKTYHGSHYSIFSVNKTYRNIGPEKKLKEHLIEDGRIFYNPHNPHESSVEQPFFMPVLSLVFGVLAIFFLVGGIHLMFGAWRDRSMDVTNTMNTFRF